MDFEQKIFDGKTFSHLLKDIYNNSKKKESKIKDLIDGLKPLVIDTQSSLMIVPLIKEYLDISVKNDDALIKMAAIVQRAIANSGGNDNDFVLSEGEKQQLFNAVKTVNEPVKENETSKK